MNRVLVTGATGFIGSATVRRLTSDGRHHVRGTIRRVTASADRALDMVQVEDLTATTDWGRALDGVDLVVHTAARVHMMSDRSLDPLAEYRRVNVEGTLHLAREAAKAGARRFVFLSSIKVNGERTAIGHPFRASDPPRPIDPYGVSKFEAECGLREIGAESRMQIVIVRPVLVYGPGVGANFRSMMRWLTRGVPLPFGAIRNARSLVAAENLVDLIVVALEHAGDPSGTYLVSDGEDLSTPALLRRTAKALGVSARLLPVPPGLLLALARLVGREDMMQRLCDSLQVDIEETRVRLGWQPPVTVDAALAGTARHLR